MDAGVCKRLEYFRLVARLADLPPTPSPSRARAPSVDKNTKGTGHLPYILTFLMQATSPVGGKRVIFTHFRSIPVKQWIRYKILTYKSTVKFMFRVALVELSTNDLEEFCWNRSRGPRLKSGFEKMRKSRSLGRIPWLTWGASFMCLLYLLPLLEIIMVTVCTEASRQFFPRYLQSWAQIFKRKGIAIRIWKRAAQNGPWLWI